MTRFIFAPDCECQEEPVIDNGVPRCSGCGAGGDFVRVDGDSDEMDELLDRKYCEGQHALAQSMLQHVAQFLKKDDRDRASLLRELDASRMVIRRLCELIGDTDWDDNLWLPDVLEKHLARHVEE